MKLSFSTLPCEGWTVEELIACCQTYGFTGIELKEDANYAVSITSTDAELQRASELFRSAGITVTNIGTRVRFTGVEEDAPAKMQELKRNIDIAQVMEAKGVRIMLGNHYKIKHTVLPLDRDRIIAYVREACDYAAERSVEVWIETHNEFSTGYVLRKLLHDVNRSNFKVLYDIIHPYEFGEAPEDTVRLFGNDCTHVHMKDGVPFENTQLLDWKYTVTGDGQLPIASMLRLLQESEYDGYYSLEWEPKWRPELRELNLDVHQVLASYAAYMKSNFQKSDRGVNV